MIFCLFYLPDTFDFGEKLIQVSIRNIFLLREGNKLEPSYC